MALVTQTEMNVNWEPVQESERYTSLDLLRGFALFGVLAINLLYFFRESLFAHIVQFHSHSDYLNRAVDIAVTGLLEFKAFTLFSLTFGIGVAIQAERADLRGRSAALFLMRRFLVLFGFGLMHLLLISNVDILTLYAACGLAAILLLRVPPPLLVLVGLSATYVPSVIPAVEFPAELTLRAHAAAATHIYSTGTFTELVAFRWQETKQFIFPLLAGSAQRTFGLMLLGIAVWRFGIIREPRRHRKLLLSVLIAGAFFGAISTTAEVARECCGGRIPVPGIAKVFGTDIPLALAFAAGLLLWQPSQTGGMLACSIAAAGRMAFTNYLTQSIIFALLFYGYGGGLFGRLAPAPALVIGICIYAVQLWFSRWWLRRYRFGPFEWLWRSLTYGRPQQLRIAEVP